MELKEPNWKKRGGRKRKSWQYVVNKKNLMAVAHDRGIRNLEGLYDALAEFLCYEKSKRYRVKQKVSYGEFTYADIVLISNGFKMTPAEFLAVWFVNLFREVDGQIVADLTDELKEIYEERLHYSRNERAKRNTGTICRDNKVKAVIEAKEFLENFDK